MLTRTAFRLSSTCLFVAKLAIAAMTLLTVADVVLRMLFRAPVPGTYELVGMLGAIGVAGALPHVQRTGAFIFVETVTEHFTGSAKRRLRGVTLGVEVVFLFVLAAQFILATEAIKRSGQVTDILHMPQWVVYAAVSIGMIVVAAVAAVQFLELVKGQSVHEP
ncbi:MAG: TRAP transporter small permease [Burkholderiaceae bacterium]|nr:TRAP transporter small permease [Burkholderiaceae bacterium]